MSRVLVVATSRKTRGGITSVVKAHEQGPQWESYHCHWVQTHRDGPAWRKMGYLVTAFIDYCLRLPFCDIVHLHISQPTTVRRKRVFFDLARVFGKKTVVHFHAFNVEETVGGPDASLYKHFFTNANRVVVLSQWWKAQIAGFGINPSNITVLYNPCPKIERVSNSKGSKTILYAGTVGQRKGCIDLIKAFAEIAGKHPGWRLAIAGNGEIDKCREVAKELHVEDRVDFLGWVSGAKKASAFETASIFCLPSYAEGFPMAVLDAWAYGLPVVTTPVGGIPDIAKDGENMLLFNPGDIATLAMQLDKMMTDDNMRGEIARQSAILAKTTFNQDNINRQLGELYAELM